MACWRGGGSWLIWGAASRGVIGLTVRGGGGGCGLAARWGAGRAGGEGGGLCYQCDCQCDLLICTVFSSKRDTKEHYMTTWHGWPNLSGLCMGFNTCY